EHRIVAFTRREGPERLGRRIGSLIAFTQLLKSRARLQPLGEIFFVGRKTRANRAVEPVDAVGLHLLSCFLRGPPLLGHSVRRDIHSGTIVANAAMDKNFLAGVLANQHQEFSERLVLRMEAAPGKRHILHSELGHHLAFAVASTAQVHHNLDSHFWEVAKTSLRWLPAPVKLRSYLAESRHAVKRQLADNRMI